MDSFRNRKVLVFSVDERNRADVMLLEGADKYKIANRLYYDPNFGKIQPGLVTEMYAHNGDLHVFNKVLPKPGYFAIQRFDNILQVVNEVKADVEANSDICLGMYKDAAMVSAIAVLNIFGDYQDERVDGRWPVLKTDDQEMIWNTCLDVLRSDLKNLKNTYTNKEMYDAMQNLFSDFYALTVLSRSEKGKEFEAFKSGSITAINKQKFPVFGQIQEFKKNFVNYAPKNYKEFYDDNLKTIYDGCEALKITSPENAAVLSVLKKSLLQENIPYDEERKFDAEYHTRAVEKFLKFSEKDLALKDEQTQKTKYRVTTLDEFSN